MPRDWPDPRLPDGDGEFAGRILAGLFAVAMLVSAVSCARQAFAARPPTVPAGVVFTCTPRAIWDGDGPIWCAEGPRLRLADVAARELDGSCRAHHPCPAASGIAARDELVRQLGGRRGRSGDGHILVAGAMMACRSRGPDRYGRTLATCRMTGGGDLGRSLILAGVALPWR